MLLRPLLQALSFRESKKGEYHEILGPTVPVAPHLLRADAVLQDRRGVHGMAERPPGPFRDGGRPAVGAPHPAPERAVPARGRQACSPTPSSPAGECGSSPCTGCEQGDRVRAGGGADPRRIGARGELLLRAQLPRAHARRDRRALRRRGPAERPHGFLPIAAGDMYGIKGIDHLAKKGLLATVLAGSYPSGPSSMESPAIWKMIAADEVAATTCLRRDVRHAARRGGRRRGADAGRSRHVRRPAPPGRR